MTLKIGGLVALDQITKLIGYYFLRGKIIKFPGNLYLLKVVKNESINAMFNIMDISLPPWVTTIARILALFVFIMIIVFCEKEYKGNSYLNFAKIFMYAMVISSIIDSSLWEYTLDFIVLKDLLAIDLKDIYASVGIGAFFIYGIKIEFQLRNNKKVKRYK